MTKTAHLEKENLESVAELVAGGVEIEAMDTPDLIMVLTAGTYIADRCIAELERRGELEFMDGQPVIPYCSDHAVENILTREPH